MTGIIEHVSKIEAARRLTNEAIRLHFERRDSLAIHSLAAAAHQVLSDICIAKGHQSIIKNNPYLRPERKAEWFQIINRSFNFLKHAERDADRVLEFRPAMTAFYILDSILIFQQLTGTIPHEFNIFRLWFNLKFPDLLIEGKFREFVERGLAEGIDPDDYESLLDVLRTRPAGAA